MTVLRKPRRLVRLRKEMIAAHAVFVNFSIYTRIMANAFRHFSAKSSVRKMDVGIVTSWQRTDILQMISVIVTARIWKGCGARFLTFIFLVALY
jgi:hypothetical protein